MSGPGVRLIQASWAGTLIFSIAAVFAAIDPDGLAAPGVVIDLILFFGGGLAMFWAFLIAVQRSRTDAIGIGGLYFGAGSAPRRVQVQLMSSLAAQVVVGFTVASLRPFTSVAFAILVPVWGLGLAGLWCAQHGEFAHRESPGQ